MKLREQQIQTFQETIWNYYANAARHMPWRDNHSPYFVLVSEIMLQQTQVQRVLPKFELFIKAFPNFQALANTSLAEVLVQWSGLGYNRRAKFLQATAQRVCRDFRGQLPSTLEELITLPGIGKNTAGAIMAYAFNRPALFIETNIRTVYFYHFFANRRSIADDEVLVLLIQTIDHEHPREWYWALMDYGAHLKQVAGNNIALSKHYTKQSAFTGSKRQLRGLVLKLLLDQPQSQTMLAEAIDDPRLANVLQALAKEGFIYKQGQYYSLMNPDT